MLLFFVSLRLCSSHLLLSASTYFIVRVLSACAICILPHLGILLFFIRLVFFFFVALISRVAFFLLCSRTRYASTWFAYLDSSAFVFSLSLWPQNLYLSKDESRRTLRLLLMSGRKNGLMWRQQQQQQQPRTAVTTYSSTKYKLPGTRYAIISTDRPRQILKVSIWDSGRFELVYEYVRVLRFQKALDSVDAGLPLPLLPLVVAQQFYTTSTVHVYYSVEFYLSTW